MRNKTMNSHKTGGFLNRLFRIKIIASIWVGKLFLIITRLSGHGGTTLPGRIALKIEPMLTLSLISFLPLGTLIITGTNGKTTTSALTTGILKEAGYRCIHNQSGSNLAWGVASSLVARAGLSGRLSEDIAIMEVDEGALPGVTENIKPRGITITNIFRDQLDRYGEVDQVLLKIKKGLELQPKDGFEAINADDPSLTGIKLNNKKRWLYGLELDLPADTFKNTGRDMKACPFCRKELQYDKLYYAHLGHYHCHSCGYKRPQPDIRLVEARTQADGTTLLQIELPGETTEIKFPLLGTYNLYNLLAAVTTAKALDIPTSLIAEALEKSIPSFGRMELFKTNGKTIVMALIKNPVGANEVLRTLTSQSDRINLLVAINDKIADGTDVSWLWDVDFEQLAVEKDNISGLYASGLRAWDMAVRFKYASFNPDQVIVEEDTEKAVRAALEATSRGCKLFILPSYTAMLEIRRALNKMGLGKPYWEE
ncbi:MAG: MurT ligase domain-containing protein [Bacillota bacterium]